MVEEIVVARDEWRVMGGHGYISCTKAIFSSWSALTKSALEVLHPRQKTEEGRRSFGCRRGWS